MLDQNRTLELTWSSTAILEMDFCGERGAPFVNILEETCPQDRWSRANSSSFSLVGLWIFQKAKHQASIWNRVRNGAIKAEACDFYFTAHILQFPILPVLFLMMETWKRILHEGYGGFMGLQKALLALILIMKMGSITIPTSQECC